MPVAVIKLLAALGLSLTGPVMIALLAAESGGSGNSGSYVSVALLSAALSVLGVILSGKIVVPTFAYKREQERADKWEAEALRLNGEIASKFVPSLDAAVHAVNESSGIMKQLLAKDTGAG